MDLSICIVTRNCANELRNLLISLRDNPPTRSYEVLLQDNDSSDGVEKVVAKFPEVRLAKNTVNLYWVAASNQLFRRAAGRFILSLNPDIELRPHALDGLVSFLEANPQAGAVVPKYFNGDGSVQGGIAGFPSTLFGIMNMLLLHKLFPRNRIVRRTFPLPDDWDSDQTQEADVLYASCILFRREALTGIGLWDEHIIQGWAEFDFCRTLKKAGWKLFYYPESEVTHKRSAGGSQYILLSQKLQLWTDGLLYLYWKHASASAYFLVKAFSLPRQLLCLVAGLKDDSPSLSVAKGRLSEEKHWGGPQRQLERPEQRAGPL